MGLYIEFLSFFSEAKKFLVIRGTRKICVPFDERRVPFDERRVPFDGRLVPFDGRQKKYKNANN